MGDHLELRPPHEGDLIGIAMLPEARGHGDGTQAHRLLARYLLAHTTRPQPHTPAYLGCR